MGTYSQGGHLLPVCLRVMLRCLMIGRTWGRNEVMQGHTKVPEQGIAYLFFLDSSFFELIMIETY